MEIRVNVVRKMGIGYWGSDFEVEKPILRNTCRNSNFVYLTLSNIITHPLSNYFLSIAIIPVTILYIIKFWGHIYYLLDFCKWEPLLTG